MRPDFFDASTSVRESIIFINNHNHMGRGDKRSKKGKRWRGSFGVSRPKAAAAKSAQPTPAPAKKEKGN